MKISLWSAIRLLDGLYELNSMPKLADGKYAICCEDGWYSMKTREAASDLASGELEYVDLVMTRIAELGGEPPLPEIELDGDVCLRFDSETSLGEPQGWIYLKDGTSLEITHEEHGLSASEQYFSARLHCSEKDFEDDKFHSTMGIIEQCSGGLASIGPMVDRVIEERGIEEPFKEPDHASIWEDVGPRAVMSLIAVLYEKKLAQGKSEQEADREADEDACEMTGISLSDLGDLYEDAGFDRPTTAPDPEWTPCTKDLPVTPTRDENPEVLITTLDKTDGVREVFKGFYEDGEWWTQWIFGCKRISEDPLGASVEVIAWKPLPKPYGKEV